MSTAPLYLSASQVAELIQVDEKTVLRWSLEDATMPVLRRGRVVRFPRERLLTWLERQEPRALVRDRHQIVERAMRHRLPTISGNAELVEVGGLMSYGGSTLDSSRRAAAYVDKILKGAKPADLPVDQPTKFELVVNLRTATALGLTIPPSLLQRADQVIQ